VGPQDGQEPPTLEEQAQDRARRIQALEGGHRLHAEGELARELATLDRNVERGYSEWIPRRNMLRRTQELVGTTGAFA
jgi:hypothetical protein